MLVDLYLLHNLCNPSQNAELGLYSDDGLAVVRNASGPIVDKIKKKIIKILRQHNLKITTVANLIHTDFLDVTFNLDTEKYRPYRKPENQPLYINAKSNHPSPIKKQLPHMIASRISQNSSDINEFQKAKPIYEDALKKSGYNENLQYASKPNLNNTHQSIRKRQIIWFNPPFTSAVSTNIGKEFFKLMDKHFPEHHKLHNICNRNNVKLSYSCMQNMQAIINRHNKTFWPKTAK